MKRLEGKVAVITGGSSGIGLATAQQFVSEGAYVFITGRRQNEVDAAVDLMGNNNATGVQGDVSKLADLDRLYTKVKEQKITSIFFSPTLALGKSLHWRQLPKHTLTKRSVLTSKDLSLRCKRRFYSFKMVARSF
jgi:NAD(P)-dependent dehydrogenase (short-subunit alcohol dehydrogenase family)